MKSKLLATVAFAAVVGLGGVAAAQSQMGGESNKSTGATQERSGGGMSGSQSGNKTLSPSSSESGKSSGQSTQGLNKNESGQSSRESAQGTQKSGKDNERLGQGANQDQKGMTRGAQDEKRGSDLKGAERERSMQRNQKGAREEQRGKNLQGAQEQQRGTAERNATEQNGRTGVNTGANVEGRGQRGGSVQLSEDQRSQIKTVIGRGHGPRVGNVNFNVSVGTRVPHNVHVEVLPSDIVRIVPQYRGYRYFLYEDEIVIIDPRTFEIVAVIPA